jgi:CTP synthase (UTP-ammonia lyase)
VRSLGIGPNCLICRSEKELPKDEKKKIALFCSVEMSNVISMHDVDKVYWISLLFNKKKVDEIVFKDLGFKKKKFNFNDWEKVV